MKKLIKGLHKFQTEVFPIQKDFFHNLSKGQSPETLFISCSDSRINPHLVTSADPGDLFILRNAGNIIPLYGSGGSEAATIEFALCALKVSHIIICGHSHCGAVEAAIHPEKMCALPNLQKWITANITPTLTLVQRNYPETGPETLQDILLQEHILRQVENLKTYPVVTQAIENNQLTLHAWVYDLQNGDILSFNQQSGQFEQIKHLES